MPDTGEGPFRSEPGRRTHDPMQTDPGETVPVRVVLVDADDRVRESLCGLICIGDRIVVVGSAGQAETALDIVRETHPDVVVLDPRLPDVDGGLSFIARVRASAPGVRVVVMSGADTDDQRDLASVGRRVRPQDLPTRTISWPPSSARSRSPARPRDGPRRAAVC